MITIAGSNVLPRLAMSKIVTYMEFCGLNILRHHVDTIDDPEYGEYYDVTIGRYLVTQKDETHKISYANVFLHQDNYSTIFQM